MRELILFTHSDAVANQWAKLQEAQMTQVKDIESLKKVLLPNKTQIVLYDKGSLNNNIETLMQEIKVVDRSYLFVLSGRPYYEEGLALLKLKISGYGNSYMDSANLKTALDVIEEGNVWLYPDFIQALVVGALHSSEEVPKQPKQRDIRLDMLTEKEHEVAQYIAQGMANKEIASQLGITERTVKAHLSNIYMKLEIGDRLTLALMLQE